MEIIYLIILYFISILLSIDFRSYIDPLTIYKRKQEIKWTWFIYKNINKLKKIDDNHFKIKNKDKDYIIRFHNDSKIFSIIEGKTKKDIYQPGKYDLMSHSNYCNSNYPFYIKYAGNKIEKWHIKQLINVD